MGNVWFTSDWHLGHINIIKHCNRPFSDIKEMNEAIIDNHNALVKQKDIVYHHGDISFKTNYKYISDLMSKFNGVFHVLKGNHDKLNTLQILKNDGFIKSVQDVLEIKVNGQYIWMSHYPHRSWNRSFHGSWHTFGHCHGTVKPFGYSFDVGIDPWNYKPVHFDEVVAKMKEMQLIIKNKACQFEMKIS